MSKKYNLKVEPRGSEFVLTGTVEVERDLGYGPETFDHPLFSVVLTSYDIGELVTMQGVSCEGSLSESLSKAVDAEFDALKEAEKKGERARSGAFFGLADAIADICRTAQEEFTEASIRG